MKIHYRGHFILRFHEPKLYKRESTSTYLLCQHKKTSILCQMHAVLGRIGSWPKIDHAIGIGAYRGMGALRFYYPLSHTGMGYTTCHLLLFISDLFCPIRENYIPSHLTTNPALIRLPLVVWSWFVTLADVLSHHFYHHWRCQRQRSSVCGSVL